MTPYADNIEALKKSGDDILCSLGNCLEPVFRSNKAAASLSSLLELENRLQLDDVVRLSFPSRFAEGHSEWRKSAVRLGRAFRRHDTELISSNFMDNLTRLRHQWKLLLDFVPISSNEELTRLD